MKKFEKIFVFVEWIVKVYVEEKKKKRQEKKRAAWQLKTTRLLSVVLVLNSTLIARAVRGGRGQRQRCRPRFGWPRSEPKAVKAVKAVNIIKLAVEFVRRIVKVAAVVVLVGKT